MHATATTIATEECITDLLADYADRFGDSHISCHTVSASMPSSVKAPYSHYRVYKSTDPKPHGHALRNHPGYVEETVSARGFTLRARCQQILEAVRRHNAAVTALKR